MFIIGGAFVYRQTLPLADKLYLTIVDDAPDDADVYFPEIDYSQWKEISREHHDADERHIVAYVFVEYMRK